MASISALTSSGIKSQNFWPITSGATIVSVTTQTATTYEVVLSNGASLRYTGSGFAYTGNPALPTAGTYASIDFLDAAKTVLARLEGANGALNLILTGDPGEAVLAGNDTITGGAGNDVIFGRAGDDLISDTSGTVTNIDAGVGNDAIIIGANTFAVGTIRGAVGTDTLFAEGDIHGLTLAGLEVLQTGFGAVIATAAQLEVFDTIRFDAGRLLERPTLNLFATGAATALDLADELNSNGPRGVNLNGSSDAEALTTGAGSDSVDGRAGDDSITSGAGADTLIGDAGNDTLRGGADADRLEGGAGSDSLDGGDGNDVIIDATTDVPGPRTTFIEGGLGDDALIIGGATFNAGSIFGGEGTDTLFAEGDIHGLTLAGLEVLQTGFGAVIATAAQLEVFDTIRFDAGRLLERPTLNLFATGAATALDLADELNSNGPRGVNLNGSSDAEALTTGAGSDSVDGRAGDDSITSGAGADTLIGDAGNDTLDGGLGDDVIDGGAGINTVSYASASGGVSVNLAFAVSGANGSDSLINIQNVIGSAFDDAINGNSANNRLTGGAGNDTLIDLSGASATLEGGSGNDFIQTTATSGTIAGGTGQDTLFADVISGLQVSGVESLFTFGGNVIGTAAQFEAFDHIQRSGDDFVSLISLQLAGTGAVTVLDLRDEMAFAGGIRSLFVNGSADDETFVMGSAADFINTGFGNNTVNAGDGNDQINAGDGTDLLRGEGGDDNLNADAFGANPLTSRDTLFGGDGNDVLFDGPGASTFLDGGAGNDVLRTSVLTGTIEGGTGEDTLLATGNLTGLSINRVETLFMADFSPTATAAQFEAFDHIQRGGEGNDVLLRVSLQLAATGSASTLDLTDELAFVGGVRAVSINASSDSENLTTSSGDDVIFGFDGNDTVDAGLGNDQMFGGTGVNTLSYTGFTGNLTIDLSGFANGGAEGSDTFTNFQNAISGAGNDVLNGTNVANLLNGGAGNDVVTGDRQNDGAGGNDTLIGGTGDDTIIDMFGSEAQVFGGTGNDRVTLGFNVNTGPTSGVLDGGEDASGLDNDILILSRDTNLTLFTTFTGFETLFAGASLVTGRAADFTAFSSIGFNDTFPANPIRLALLATGEVSVVDLTAALTAGAATRVTITGSSDDEAISTASGNDSLVGGEGFDTLSGGTGNDTLTGGAGP